jgi:hypothetical protein
VKYRTTSDRYRTQWTMPYEKDSAEPDYWVSFFYTPAEKPNGHYHPNDPDTPAPAMVEDIQVEMPEDARKLLDSQPETWPCLEEHCREAAYRQSTGRDKGD